MVGTVLGRDTSFSISLDAGVTFRLLGPVTAHNPTVTGPTQDVTAQDTESDESAFAHTGYAQMQVAVAGIVRQLPGTDPIFAQPLYTYKELAALVNASPISARKGLFRIADSGDLFEGNFLITEFARSGGRSDVQEFTMSLQNEGGIAYQTGDFYDFMIFMEKTLPDLWAPFL